VPTTSADLTGARRKLARAGEKLGELNLKVAAYLDPPPFQITTEAGGDRQAIVCRIDREPQEAWADDMAEIAYQARSALDLLVQQLVVDNGRQPGRRNQFPIFRRHDQYVNAKPNQKSKRETMLAGVASRHRHVIDSFQPYQRGSKFDRDPLAVLATISNRDKHNDVYVCVAASETFVIKLIRPSLRPPDQELKIRFGEKFIPLPMLDGQELFAIEWTPDAGSSEVPMEEVMRIEPVDMQPTLGFHSGDRTFLLQELDRAVLAVAQVIDRCVALMQT
jgi:hypothetical protein